jgi:putative membrane protein
MILRAAGLSTCTPRINRERVEGEKLNRALAITTAAIAVALVVTGRQVFDRGTWLLEVFPIFVALPVMWATRERFPLTGLLYVLIFMHAVVLMVGGEYTYARVPLGFDLQAWLHLARNPYDRIGHFFQGFVPAIVAREVLVRGGYVRGRAMLAFLVLCVVLAISATYELVEWGAALALGQGADEFLATQGDPWDTQSDMLCALIGGASALVLLGRLHDRQIAKLGATG